MVPPDITVTGLLAEKFAAQGLLSPAYQTSFIFTYAAKRPSCNLNFGSATICKGGLGCLCMRRVPC